jgi:hypothetical protein
MDNSRLRKALFGVSLAFTFIVTLSLTSLSVVAQTTTGTLRGTVTDQQGAAVPNATVQVKNQATGVMTSEFQTTGEGLYTIPNLIPGKYDVIVTATGFNKTTTTGADVRLGQDTTIDVQLKAGDVNAEVSVVANTEEVINTDQSQVSASFESRKISELPSNVSGGGIDTLA